MQKTSYIIEQIDTYQCNDLLFYFTEFAERPWSLLIDSAGSRENSNQYDIILHSPAFTLTCKNKQTVVTNTATNIKKVSFDDPIEEAKKLHAILKQNITKIDGEFPENLPFIAGIAGLFGYDLGRNFEDLPSPYRATTEDSKGEYDCPDMALGVYQRSLILDKINRVIYDCRPMNMSPVSLGDKAQPVTQPFSLTTPWQSNFTKSDYIAGLEKIHSYLTAGDCYQVNFAQRFSAQYEGSEWHAYLKLRESNKAPFSAFMRLPNSSVISISPERFLSVRDTKVQTKPIKGTRPRSSDPAIDAGNAHSLLNSSKDRAENLMIVDLLRNDISKHCLPHSVTVPQAFKLESYAAVHHMVTTIEGKLDECSDPFTLLRDAFPGGSITGAPKIRAMQIIDELEPNARNVYCGSIGYIGLRDDMDTSICIRTLLCEKGKVYCWAGGGIVLDSDPESEYQETLDKVNKILPILS
jgi:para-aminobenzoate synthetase component 1